MFVLLSLVSALADDSADLIAYAAELDTVDARIADVDTWYAAAPGPEHVAEGEKRSEELKKAAVRSREINRALVAVKGRFEAGSKADQARVPEVDALMDRVRAQTAARTSAVSAIDAGLALERVIGGDPKAFAQLNNSLYTAVQFRPADAKSDVDLWLRKPLEVALEKEQWAMVFSWGSWCEAACKDGAFAKRALESVPERHGRDARWLALLTAPPAP
ncbi:MAG: hypothetical protein R3F61_11460 [Myxococcota bacterium]